ncbi:hypothetical protein PMI16_02155 [Herbaspirillum sp. CF444]|uniref:scabin-related ADP-ribosyltransferase n=1 Tax=Herbaspirillum sp. CF444 TaxID=1144319 RepID=UPI0002726E65|nr:hypothetical protein [Herbaspirillum sp. CF444]EJL88511.1 hypothetical protein PMI16_02155 [Herbaspirillum sp. CF444]
MSFVKSTWRLLPAILLSVGIIAGTPAQDIPRPDQYPKECQPGSKSMPGWLHTLVEKGQVNELDYLNQPWYETWLSTTLSVCPDLAHVYSGDGPLVGKVLWRGDRLPLFRGGVGRDPNEVFTYGFYPWKYDGIVKLYSGSRNLESPIVNTGYQASYDFDIGFGVLSGNEAYLIDAPGGINQSESSGYASQGELPKHAMAEANIGVYRNVVVFPGGIKREYIKGAFKVNTKNHKLEYLPNPNYSSSQPGADEFDIVLADALAIDGGNARLLASPEGARVGNIAYRYKKGTQVTITLKDGGIFSSDNCWHVNTTPRSQATAEPLSLTAEDEVLPVFVVWRGSCRAMSLSTNR